MLGLKWLRDDSISSKMKAYRVPNEEGRLLFSARQFVGEIDAYGKPVPENANATDPAYRAFFGRPSLTDIEQLARKLASKRVP